MPVDVEYMPKIEKGGRPVTRRQLAAGLIGVLCGMILSFAALTLWAVTYPDDSDPKNIYYVLWKHGLNSNMNLDHALDGMVHDTFSSRFVVGLDKSQLKERFGRIRELKEVEPYYQRCPEEYLTYRGTSFGASGKEALFLRDSILMVVLENERATDLVVCKGY